MLFRTPTRKEGIIAVLVGLCLVTIVGVAAIAIDGGLLLDQRRRVQAAADAAALAAAADLYGRYPYNGGFDYDNKAQACALSIATANGYSNDGTTNVVTVSVPPLTGDHVGQAGYAEVTVQFNQPRGFSGIFGQGDIPVKARAVAEGKWTYFQNGILLLDPTGEGSFHANGNGFAIVTGAGIVINSSDDQAAQAVGGGAGASAPAFDITGIPGTNTASKFVGGAITSGVPPTPDPLSYLPAVDPSSLVIQATDTVSVKGSMTLSSGWYKGGISGTGGKWGDLLTLLPGVYYLGGVGWTDNSKVNVVGNGVMLYIALGAQLDLGGNGNLTLSPPTSGIYRGLTVFQDRSSTAEVKLHGNGTQQISGTLYAAHARFNMVGNGATSQLGSQLICWNLNLSGNGNINVNWFAQDTARIRIIRLVE
ncbi:MAG: pilus assembly protein TadG-related protein [Planctomycetota bacterium]|nr:pilus assembly protein TadG-related protein [Planctomycetota bacterium]